MIGLVVVSHGRLAEELVAALEHVVGEQEHVRAVCIGADDDMEQRRNDIRAAAKAVDKGDGVILVTDMSTRNSSRLMKFSWLAISTGDMCSPTVS